tara:strand:+ start:1450 stop:1560 length:111 start_codon:yes stop_codon:yes gene_type:complete
MYNKREGRKTMSQKKNWHCSNCKAELIDDIEKEGEQ